MRLVLFSEHWKFNVDSKNAKKKLKNSDFLYNLISIGNGKFSLLIREYL